MENGNASGEALKKWIRDIPDYPKKGILFRDITPLLKEPKAFSQCIDLLAKELSTLDFDYLVGVEARGFIMGAALAYKMKKGFIPIRKKGKLPFKKVSMEYELEYGKETIEMHSDAVEKGSKVVIIDDLLATGGTAKAAASLIESTGGKVISFAFAIELMALNGREVLKRYNIISIIRY